MKDLTDRQVMSLLNALEDYERFLDKNGEKIPTPVEEIYEKLSSYWNALDEETRSKSMKDYWTDTDNPPPL